MLAEGRREILNVGLLRDKELSLKIMKRPDTLIVAIVGG